MHFGTQVFDIHHFSRGQPAGDAYFGGYPLLFAVSSNQPAIVERILCCDLPEAPTLLPSKAARRARRIYARGQSTLPAVTRLFPRRYLDLVIRVDLSSQDIK